jgi:SAM-dependent methyltransferase
MTPRQALDHVKARFPFPGYVGSAGSTDEEYFTVARTVGTYLQAGSSVLDFGSGPADKTAVLQALGYACTAYDDLEDDWHKLPGNREKILKFARDEGVDFKLATGGALPFPAQTFDMVMLHAVIEHFHDSPRETLNDLLELVKPRGLLFITVPNAVNIRKRIDVLRGRTNLPGYDAFYWYPGPWRGHVREYVKGDLLKLAEYLGVEVLECRGCDFMLSKLPRWVLPSYLAVTKVFAGWKDSWLLVARKPADWVARRKLERDKLEQVLGQSVAFDYQQAQS